MVRKPIVLTLTYRCRSHGCDNEKVESHEMWLDSVQVPIGAPSGWTRLNDTFVCDRHEVVWRNPEDE